MIEIINRRKHNIKEFVDQNNPNKHIIHQCFGLYHYFDGQKFEEIQNIPFPEGKEINSEEDLGMIDIPKWAEVELSEDKKEAWFKDKKGVRIQRFADAFVCDKNVPHSFDKKGKVIIDENKTTKVKFVSKNGKLAFELPQGMKAENLKAFDATDTATVSADTFIASNATTSNFENWGVVQILTKSAIIQRALIRATLPSGSGTISSVKLYGMCSLSNSDAGSYVNIHSLSITDWVASQATWNRYKTGSYWTTAGGDYSATVIDSLEAVVTAENWYNFVLMGTGATNGLTLDWGDTVNLLITGVYAGTEYDVLFYDSTVSGKEPYIEITYIASNIKSINGVAYADIKSINGIAIANVKSFNGIA